jgi:hypothetical protein
MTYTTEEYEKVHKGLLVGHIVENTFSNANEEDRRKLLRQLCTKKNDDINHLVTLVELNRNDDARQYILNLL